MKPANPVAGPVTATPFGPGCDAGGTGNPFEQLERSPQHRPKPRVSCSVKKLVGALIAAMCVGCLSHARPVRFVEADPRVGDLHCAAPRLSVVEALYIDPSTPVECEARD